jgi:hypothetical protein
MISTMVSSSSLSWLVVEAITTFFAVLGGLMVFRGLWIEHKADKDKFSNVDDFRSSKLKKNRGWKMLMWGIQGKTMAKSGVIFPLNQRLSQFADAPIYGISGLEQPQFIVFLGVFLTK